MYYHKVIILLIFLMALFCSSCATSYAPSGWLPDLDNVTEKCHGGWITITAPGDGEKVYEYSGEFIATDSSRVYLLYDSLYIILKNTIQYSALELDEKNTAEYSLWIVGGCLATVSNGLYAVFTAPLWLLIGVSAVAGESSRDYYEADYPDSVYWDTVNKFSRFPQGLSEPIPNIKLKN
jgi:hypothetical protein